MLKFLKYYLPAIIWAGIIFYFSSIPGLRYSEITAWEIFLRKGAHFVEYAILSFLFWRIFYIGHKFNWRQAFWWSLIVAVFYGASDEFHQTFIFGRTGKPLDALFDALSALFILELIALSVKRKTNWKNILIILMSALALLGIELKMIKSEESSKNNFANALDIEEKTDSSDAIEVLLNDNAVENIPDKILISVPFATQAPFAVWDETHEESCEEASLIMLKYYLDKKKLTPKIAEEEIQSMVSFEMKKYGDFKDTSVQENVKLFYDFYGSLPDGKKLSTIYDFKKEDLKKYLAKGDPIIVPAAGRLLENPYFTPPGPIYHNLVLIGYDGDRIITNDPGTKRGEEYEYGINILYNAIHDFPGDLEHMEEGRKAMIIIE